MNIWWGLALFIAFELLLGVIVGKWLKRRRQR